MKRLLWLVILAVPAGLGWWGYKRSSAPPRVAFAKVTRETIVSTLTTNGKTEPVEWMAVRAARAGLVTRRAVEPGRKVAKGAVLLELDVAESRSALQAAEARAAQARAELAVLEGGGRAREMAEIDAALAQARLQERTAQRELESLERLIAKQAATRKESDPPRERIEQARLDIQSLEKKRAALVMEADRAAAKARLEQALAAVAEARRGIDLGTLRAPMAGVIYQLDARPGGWVNAGDQVAAVGRTDELRVMVFVDEPELGRVEAGMPVVITWDALPARRWEGKVEKTPSRIVTLGTRQVGEVLCRIANPGNEVPPGANVNAEIRSRSVANALTIPKETLRRQGEQTGVFVLAGDRLAWRPVKLGIASVTRTEVIEGLSEQDRAALPSDLPLEDGMPVRVK